MARDPAERYPSGGDLGEAALVAAGALRRARAWSVVATGEAGFAQQGVTLRLACQQASAQPERGALRAARPDARVPGRGRRPGSGGDGAAAPAGALRWAIALAGLVLVALGMVAALHGISTL